MRRAVLSSASNYFKPDKFCGSNLFSLVSSIVWTLGYTADGLGLQARRFMREQPEMTVSIQG